LIGYFLRNGNIRRPNPKRLREGHERYKKGWEVRLVLTSWLELRQVRRELSAVGLKAGRPYRKATRWVQPVYGREAVAFFGGHRLG
jgi:hypothetical protein